MSFRMFILNISKLINYFNILDENRSDLYLLSSPQISDHVYLVVGVVPDQILVENGPSCFQKEIAKAIKHMPFGNWKAQL